MDTEINGNNLLFQNLSEPKPFAAGRIGSIELDCLYNYLHTKTWTQQLKYKMLNNTGFFPIDDLSLEKFSKLFLDHLKNMDVLAVWRYEDFLFQEQHLDANAVKIVMLRSLEPYYHQNPWSYILKDKKVLVIHPYEDSIRQQYANHTLLFRDSKILPNFELKTIKAVQSIAGSHTQFNNWFDAFDFMCDQIRKIDFDVALIGAGAYGLPLASFIKTETKKKAVHIGGATQILFGIKGKRWDVHEDISKLYNEHWVRPAQHEIPANYQTVEGGCYW